MQKRDEARALGLAIASVAMLVHFTGSAPAIVASGLMALAAAFGAGRLTGEWRPWRMPMVSTALPAVAAFAIAGIARLVEPLPWLPVVFVAGWAAMVWVLRLEAAPEVLAYRPDPDEDEGIARVAPPTVRIKPVRRAEFDLPRIVAEKVVVNTKEVAPHPRPLAVKSAALALAFAAFAGVGGLVPGGLIVTAVEDAKPLSNQALFVFALLNGAVGGAIGYRLAGLLSPHWYDRIVRRVAVIQYVLVAGLGAALLRWMSLPRLFIPALLTLAIYLVTAMRESREPVTLNRRLLQELAVLASVALATIAWGLINR